MTATPRQLVTGENRDFARAALPVLRRLRRAGVMFDIRGYHLETGRPVGGETVNALVELGEPRPEWLVPEFYATWPSRLKNEADHRMIERARHLFAHNQVFKRLLYLAWGLDLEERSRARDEGTA